MISILNVNVAWLPHKGEPGILHANVYHGQTPTMAVTMKIINIFSCIETMNENMLCPHLKGYRAVTGSPNSEVCSVNTENTDCYSAPPEYQHALRNL